MAILLTGGAGFIGSHTAVCLLQAGYDVVDWVIGRPLGEDQKVLMEALDRAGDAAEVLISQGPDRAMNRFN